MFVILYGGKNGQSLNNLRYCKYTDVITSNKKLPPTERVAYYHNLRVYLQIQVWERLSIRDDDLEPQQWGWRLDGSVLIPIMTDIDAAPESLLKFMQCNVN